MKKNRILKMLSGFIIGFTAFAIALISIMAFVNPQAVMDMVQVKLTTTDAISSIRAVYGGIGMLLFIQLVYLLYKNQMLGLLLVALFGGFYAVSRVITIFNEGSLGAFGRQWLSVEATLCVAAVLLLVLRRKSGQAFSSKLQ